MKTVADCSNIIIPDNNDTIARWVCKGLGENTNWLYNYQTFGVMRKGKIVAGLIFHDIRVGQDVWWTIYSIDPRWCCRRIIKDFMYLAFQILKCRRINLLVNPDNKSALNFVTRLGFKIEGYLRQFRDNGSDCCILGLLKSENKYL